MQSRRWRACNAANDDQKVGINIVRKALQAPARQIVQNAGEDGSVVVGKILDSNKYVFGYNAQTGEYGDLVEAGVIDPAKVVRCALQDAASIAGLLITTEAMIAERPKETPPRRCPAAVAWAGWVAWAAWISEPALIWGACREALAALPGPFRALRFAWRECQTRVAALPFSVALCPQKRLKSDRKAALP